MKKVTVYTTHYCGYCRRAKALLAKLNIPFEEVDVEDDDERRAWLVEATGQRTVPQVFFGEESIGGYSELSALDARGELMRKLEG